MCSVLRGESQDIYIYIHIDYNGCRQDKLLLKSVHVLPFSYLMRSCAEFSAPCSCLTVVAAEAMWTDVGTGALTGGDGPAVTAPGSVFTVAAEPNRNMQ